HFGANSDGAAWFLIYTSLISQHGLVNHNVKAVYDKYMGWFDRNTAYLWPLAPVNKATEFVKCMGGSQSVLDKARKYHTDKNFRFAATILDKLVFATQSNPGEKDEEIAKQVKEDLAGPKKA
ncbi:hypothetical protein PENNAL_c0728G11219, partial [Penicillium nalgiovense]